MWYKYLCEYYNVSPEQALELGTRRSGRRPELPGSKTCQPVNGMTYEDIWSLKERKDASDIFQFYKDQGSWSSFRQVVRHKDLTQLHLTYLNFVVQNGVLKRNGHIVEYGCGVAPFMTTLLNNIEINAELNVSIADVDCEHFSFAQYSLNRIKEDRKLTNINLMFETIRHDHLPVFRQNVDVLFCFEVMEHVLSPLSAIKNITNQMSNYGIYIENFIKHDVDEDDDGPDLKSARLERGVYYSFLENNFSLVAPASEESKQNPNVTRIWQKNG